MPNAARRAIFIEYNLAFDFDLFHLDALDSLPKESFLVVGNYCKAELDTSACNVELRGIPKSRKPRIVRAEQRVVRRVQVLWRSNEGRYIQKRG